MTNRTVPIPNFNMWHKCKNWENALAFARERSLPLMKMWEPKEGEIVLHDPLGLHYGEGIRLRRSVKW